MSGNHRTVLVLKFRTESTPRSQPAQKKQGATRDSNSQPSSNTQPSSSKPNDSATKTNQGSSGNYSNSINYNVIENSSIALVQFLDKNTFIDYEELAAFLSNISHVVENWQKLRFVLGTSPSKFFTIQAQFFCGLWCGMGIEIIITRMLSEWVSRISLNANVGILCNGSNEVGNLTEGLRNHELCQAAGFIKIPKNIYYYF
jgi:activator of HSP90 ATPase